MERLAALGLFKPPHARGRGFRIRWDQLDWADPCHPRLNRAVEDLQPL